MLCCQFYTASMIFEHLMRASPTFGCEIRENYMYMINNFQEVDETLTVLGATPNGPKTELTQNAADISVKITGMNRYFTYFTKDPHTGKIKVWATLRLQMEGYF